MYTRSKELFERAQRSIPGGVNSPVRAFRSVGGTPFIYPKGERRLLIRCGWEPVYRLYRQLGADDIGACLGAGGESHSGICGLLYELWRADGA